jgi:hypothetical protein
MHKLNLRGGSPLYRFTPAIRPTAGYNSPHPMINGKRQSFIGALVLLVCTAPLSAATWNDASAELARDISGITGPGPIALSLRNASSLPAEEVPAIRLALETQLRNTGVRVAEAPPSAYEVTVTLSENIEGYLWIAAIRFGSSTRVVMRKVARAQPAADSSPSNTVVLRKGLLWSQMQPILDAVVFLGGTPEARLVVLDPDKVSLLRFNAGRWEVDQMLAVTHARPFPRDVRGRLAPARDHLFDAYLPGVVCSASPGTPPALQCRESDDPWPLQPGVPQSAFFGAVRNFFPGDLAPGIGKQTSTAPFYSAAAILAGDSLRWLFAGVDGQLRLADSGNESIAGGAHEWGSDIAAVKTACGPILLADGNGDDNAPDTVRAYEVSSRGVTANSQPIEFPGPVTALWNSGESNVATAITHNLKTRLYEAYALTISCP